jgi:putative flippase GtrA
VAAPAPNVGVAGRGIRFALAGGFVALLYLAVTTLLYEVLGLPFQLALVLGFATGLVAHFTLQRVFVWVHPDGFALPVRHQAGRYLAVAAVQYGVTAAATAVLPDLLGVRVTYVYLATVVLVTITSFLIFRSHVFHAKTPSDPL